MVALAITVTMTIVTLPALGFSVFSVPSVPPCWVYSLGRFSLIDRPPDLFRRRGHFDLFDAQRAQGVADCIHDGRRAADRAEFANPLCPEWIDLARPGLVGFRLEPPHLLPPRQPPALHDA